MTIMRALALTKAGLPVDGVERLPPDDPEPGEVCDICHGSGWLVLRAKRVYDKATSYPCDHCASGQRIRSVRTARLFGAAEIPVEYADKDFATYRAQPGADLAAADAVERYAAHATDTSLYLWGGVGGMKTGLSWCVARQWMVERGTDVVFRFCAKFYRQLRTTMGDGYTGPTLAELIDGTEQAGLVIMDDIGSEKPTDWTRETLLQIVNERGVQHRPTIFTSNLDPQALGKYVGGIEGVRLTDRILGMCDRGRGVVQVRGLSHRVD